MPRSRAASDAAGPMCSFASGYRSRWCTQNRNGSTVAHWKPSGIVWSTGSVMLEAYEASFPSPPALHAPSGRQSPLRRFTATRSAPVTSYPGASIGSLTMTRLRRASVPTGRAAFDAAPWSPTAGVRASRVATMARGVGALSSARDLGRRCGTSQLVALPERAAVRAGGDRPARRSRRLRRSSRGRGSAPIWAIAATIALPWSRPFSSAFQRAHEAAVDLEEVDRAAAAGW